MAATITNSLLGGSSALSPTSISINTQTKARAKLNVSRNDCVCTRAELRGGFIGAGAETLITEHISLRGEYRFTDFGSGKLGLPTINGTDINDFIVAHAAPTMQDTRVSVNYRF